VRRAPLAAGIALALALGACGYVKSGAWDDDPNNWERAFETTKPPDVVVVHSHYWRSPHFTLEFGYYFEIERNASLREQLFSRNDLREVTGGEAERVMGDVFGKPPAWFAPKPAASYAMWVFRDQPGRHFRVLVDRETGTIFLGDYQL
jgi:hypothetical protein